MIITSEVVRTYIFAVKIFERAMTMVIYIKFADGTVNSDLFVASALHVKVAHMT